MTYKTLVKNIPPVLHSPTMENVLTDMAEQKDPKIPMVSRKNHGFNRADIVSAFHSTFEIIGGVSRLALWANANPDKFYPLYAKLMPSTTQIIGDGGALEIIHRIAPTALDKHDINQQEVYEYEDVESREVETIECQSSRQATSPVVISAPFTRETTAGPSLSPTDVQARPSPL